MTEDHKEHVLAGCLEEFHTRRARGEIPDMAAFEKRLGDLYEEFNELILAETLIDEAMTPPSQEPLPLAFGAYTLLHELGRGAAGIVYEAVHRKLGRKVALKVLRTGIDTDETARKRFEREAQALAQVRHDNIVEIYEFGDVGGMPYYAMELVDGPTLIELVRRNQLPTPKALCAGMAGITDALHTLHENGIVHRDVKPSNIMVRKDGRYVLADFGLARTALAQTMTKSGDALGTPLYMSPEQILGNRDAVDRRTDVYGAGATLYQVLTGSPPFKTDNLHALMRMILTQRPESPRAIRPDLPGGCSSIAEKCLEKEPGDRYATADEVTRDLRAFVAGDRVSGRPLTRIQRGGRWVRRNRALSAAAVALVAVGAWFAFRPAPPPEPASLSLKVFPHMEAEVRVNDGPAMPMPLVRHGLPPDVEHTVRVRPKPGGFREWTKTYRLGAKADKEAIAEMAVDNPNHPDVVAAYAKVTEVAYRSGIKRPERHRGRDEAALEVGLPRGTVRRNDLDEWRLYVGFDFPDTYPDGGWIEWRTDDRVLGTLRFPEPPKMETVGKIPAEVLQALRPGDVVTWGFRDFRSEKGSALAASASFQVNDIDLAENLSRIDDKLAVKDEKLRSILRATLRATLLLNHDLAYAAYEEVAQAVADGTGSLYLLSLQQRALEAMYPKNAELKASTPWHEFFQRWDAYPQAERDAFFESALAR